MLERLLLLLLLLLVGFVVTSLKMHFLPRDNDNRRRVAGFLRAANYEQKLPRGIAAEQQQGNPYDHDNDYLNDIPEDEEEPPRMYKGKLPKFLESHANNGSHRSKESWLKGLVNPEERSTAVIDYQHK